MKRKVRFIASIAGNDFSYGPTNEAKLDAGLAASWVASGICVYVDAEPPKPESKPAPAVKPVEKPVAKPEPVKVEPKPATKTEAKAEVKTDPKPEEPKKTS